MKKEDLKEGDIKRFRDATNYEKRKLFEEMDKRGFRYDVFTNSIEGFWSHFRRMIVGCYHDVSDEHLQSYIDEAVYRWNTRKMSESERFAHMFDKSIGLVKKWSEIRVGLMAA